MKPFQQTEYGSKLTPEQCQFLDLMFNVNSELNKEQSFEDRMNEAITMSGLSSEAPLKGMLEHIHYYLSFYQYNNKYQLLVGKQIMFWNIQKEALTDISKDDVTKELGKMDKLSDLGDKLLASIEQLYREIYTEGLLIDNAKSEVKKAQSPEQRLKSRTNGGVKV